MSGKFLARAAAMSLALFMAACGGDDSSTPLSGTGNGNGGSPSEQFTVGSIQLLSSTPAMGSSGQDKTTITALVRDKNGILTPDVPVDFVASNNGSLAILSPVTSETGRASAELSTEGDARNRTISVTATAGSVSKSVDVAVTGTTLNLTGPSAISNGASAKYEARLLDSAGQGIGNTPVTISSTRNTVSAASLTTDSAGRVQFSVSAQNGGTDTLSVSAFNNESRITERLELSVSADNFAFDSNVPSEVEVNRPQNISITWNQNGAPVAGRAVTFSTTRGSLSPRTATTNSQGVATVRLSSNDVGVAEITALANSSSGIQIEAKESLEFVSSSPYTVSIRASKTQVSTNGEASIISTVRDRNGNLVKNANVYFSLTDPTGGTLEPGIVKTDSQGRAISTYKSTTSISDKDGVLVSAKIERNDGSSRTQSITLTVAGRALTLILGTGNTISAPSESTYDMPWSVLVTDANGNASASQPVQLSVLPLEFSTGRYEWSDASELWVPVDTTPFPTNHSDPAGTEIANPASAPNDVLTDAVGSAEFNIRYPKGECNWVRVRLTATSNVEGFSSSNSREFTLPCLSDDLNDQAVTPPGGKNSPYNN